MNNFLVPTMGPTCIGSGRSSHKWAYLYRYHYPHRGRF